MLPEPVSVFSAPGTQKPPHTSHISRTVAPHPLHFHTPVQTPRPPLFPEEGGPDEHTGVGFDRRTVDELSEEE